MNVLNKKLATKISLADQNIFKMACERVNFHVNEILTQNTDNQRLSEVSVKKAISKFVSMKQNEFQKYTNINIRYTDHTNKNLKLPIQAIYEILFNLINNALDVIEKNKGEIKISTKITQKYACGRMRRHRQGSPSISYRENLGQRFLP